MRMSNELLAKVVLAIVENGGYEADAARILMNVASKPRIHSLFAMSNEIYKAKDQLKKKKHAAIEKALDGTLFRIHNGMVFLRDDKIDDEFNLHVIAIREYAKSYAEQNDIRRTGTGFDAINKKMILRYIDKLEVKVTGEMQEVVTLAKRLVKNEIIEEYGT